MDQLELWNSNPEPWQRRFQREAFSIAFPNEIWEDGDEITINPSFTDATESWRCGEGTCYEEGEDAKLIIAVTWHGDRPRVLKPHQGFRPGRSFATARIYEGQEAVEFWMALMRKGK